MNKTVTTTTERLAIDLANAIYEMSNPQEIKEALRFARYMLNSVANATEVEDNGEEFN